MAGSATDVLVDFGSPARTMSICPYFSTRIRTALGVAGLHGRVRGRHGGIRTGDDMPTSLASLVDPLVSYGLGWSSALGCFLIAFFVGKLCASQPRLSAILALFAGAWVLVSLAIWVRLKFPGKDPGPDLLFLSDRSVDMASFLLVFTGCALAREAGRDHWADFYQKWAQVAALWLCSTRCCRRTSRSRVNSRRYSKTSLSPRYWAFSALPVWRLE